MRVIGVRYFLGKQRDLRLLAQTSPLQHPSPLLLTQEGLLGGEEDRQPWGTVPDHYVPLRTRRVRYTFQHSPMMEQVGRRAHDDDVALRPAPAVEVVLRAYTSLAASYHSFSHDLLSHGLPVSVSDRWA